MERRAIASLSACHVPFTPCRLFHRELSGIPRLSKEPFNREALPSERDGRLNALRLRFSAPHQSRSGKNPIGKDSFLRHWEQRALFLQRPEHLEVCRLPPISALCGEAVLPPFIGADDIDLSVSRPPASEMQECFRDFSFEAPSEQILPACLRKRFMSEFSKIRLDLLFPA